MAKPKPAKPGKKLKPTKNGKAGKVKTSVTVDFTGVSDGFPRVPDGDYFVKVVKVETKESESGNDYLLWTLEVADGKHSGKNLRHITTLQPQGLFNLRNTLEAIGETVTKSKMKLSLKSYIDRVLGVTVENELYQGRKQSRVVDVYEAASAEDLREEDDDEDEDDEEEDEDTDDDDVDEDDESEDDEDDDDESEEEAEDDDADDEDEPEEEPVKEAAPAKTKKTSAKKAKASK